MLYSQKIVPLDLGAPHADHYEMLLRMRGEDGGFIPPMSFIPSAERYGLMPQLDRRLITITFSHYTARQKERANPVVCAINLSGATVCDTDFSKFVRGQFACYDVPPSAICFETTETSSIAISRTLRR